MLAFRATQEVQMGLILWLIIGGVVGWLASMIMRTDAQQGVLLNIVAAQLDLLPRFPRWSGRAARHCKPRTSRFRALNALTTVTGRPVATCGRAAYFMWSAEAEGQPLI
jgi:hypothetical protein